MLLKTWPLLLLLLVGGALRVARIASDECASVEIDGAEYCRIAESIAAGQPLHGMLPGPATMMPSLYPFTIAAAMPLCGGDSVLAARVVSLLASLASIALAWWLAQRMAGSSAALAAATALAFAPLFVLAGSSTFAEALQLALLLGALIALHATLTAQHMRSACLAGALFGLAALTRIESVVLAALAVFWMLLPRAAAAPAAAMGGRTALRVRKAALCALVCALFLLPWAAHLRSATGAWRIEAKSARVAATVERFALGHDYASSNYALDAQGNALGPWLRPDVPWSGTPADPSPRGLMAVLADHPREVLSYWTGNLKRTGWWMLSGHILSSALVVLGSLWGWRALRRRHAHPALATLLLLMVIAVVLLGCLYKPVLRYSATAGMLLWLLAAVGAASFAAHSARPRLLVSALMLLGVLTTLSGVPERLQEFAEGRDDTSTRIGHALRALPLPPGPLLCTDARVPFACGRDWLPLPAAPSAQALTLHAENCGAAALLWSADKAVSAQRPGSFAQETALILPGFSESSAAPQGWRVFVRVR